MWNKALEHMLHRLIRHGHLIVNLPGGQTIRAGDAQSPPITVTIHDRATLRHLALDPELAVGEAYMDGRLTIDGDDIRGFLALALRNMDCGDRVSWQRAHLAVRTWLRSFMQHNLPSLARKNVAHHYDLSGALYERFLDADRQYSCAYFRTPDDTLEQAQAQKKEHIARKLRLAPGMRVLDIGCGWGGMALTLAREHGAQVDGITLSREQLAVAKQRAKSEGLEDKVTFRLADYRTLEGRYDRIVSVGMFEHVGLPQYDTYFRTVERLLAPDGVALIHTIGITDPPRATNPWIAKYIFPGGYIPSLSEVTSAIERQDLLIADIECLWLHYAETLRHWIERFEAEAAQVESLYDARFVRMWRYYLAACEQTFRNRRQTVFQVQLARRPGVVPVTRDYLYEAPHRATLAQAAE